MGRFRLMVLAMVSVLILGSAPAWADDEGGSAEGPVVSSEEEAPKHGKGARRIAAILARHFDLVLADAGIDAVLPDYPTADLGFADLFKINVFLAAGGNPELIANACDAEGVCEFEWGELFKDLDLPEGPRNLGQLISAEKRGHGRPDHAASHGKPEVKDKPAGGRNQH